MEIKQKVKTIGIALILVKNKSTEKYLAVNEKDGTWWLPGGKIDAPQYFTDAAIRQTKQEAGININLKGVLRFQFSPSTVMVRNKIIFYAQPKNPEQKPKAFADKQSLGARYLTLKEIVDLKDKWRGPELFQWADYIQKGGKIHPLQLFFQQKK